MSKCYQDGNWLMYSNGDLGLLKYQQKIQKMLSRKLTILVWSLNLWKIVSQFTRFNIRWSAQRSGRYSMKWTEFKKKFLELCGFNNMDINDVNVVKTYWERGYTVEETYEIWEDGVWQFHQIIV